MIEYKENQAIYLQIADRFIEKVLKGKWQADDKLPSVREAAVAYEVNPNTALKTFNVLQEQGIIYNKRGLGYFVASDGQQKAREWKKEQFLAEELPAFFRSMKLLNISFEDLQQLYQKHHLNGSHS